jgi:hypothetical protein
MKKIFVLLLILFLCIQTPQSVFAHVLKIDGSIGAILHINPEDEPVAGKQSDFFFEFKDKTGKFTPEKCDCSFIVLQNGKTLVTESLFQTNAKPDLQNAIVSFTFPEKDIYIVRVTGKPLSAGTFQAFTLDYTIRVDKGVGEQPKPNAILDNWFVAHMPHILILIVLVAFIAKSGLQERKIKKHTAKDDKS